MRADEVQHDGSVGGAQALVIGRSEPLEIDLSHVLSFLGDLTERTQGRDLAEPEGLAKCTHIDNII